MQAKGYLIVGAGDSCMMGTNVTILHDVVIKEASTFDASAGGHKIGHDISA